MVNLAAGSQTTTKKVAPIHQQMDQFAVQDQQLLIAGFKLDEIARLINQDVFYAYDLNVIEKQIENFKQHIPQSIKLHYAIKANPYPALVNAMVTKVDGFDVASHKEMLLALQSGMPASEISFAGPAKQEVEITAAIEAGITLHVESLTELERAISLSKCTNKQAKIAFRVNPAFELKGAGMKMGGGPKQFGIDEEILLDKLPKMDFSQFEFVGFHIFWGSQNLKPDAIMNAHNCTFELADRLCAVTPVKVKTINIGGGFGVPYFAGETRLNLAPIGENLSSLLTQYSQLTELELVIELGRYLVAEAGIYACKVTDIKTSRGHTYIMTNGGLHHHLSNSGNFGQVIRKNYPVAIANKMNEAVIQEPVSVVGPLCTPLDTLADKFKLPQAEIGDWFVVYQSGAYGATASPQDFLGHPHVTEILL
ncbi:pyridoxal-dependent decarboxylase, exosortase A system-associated [Flocculibacter collagenilyticus]|uniref:pyridoxal-dependent decarboxylase, exosortase A system-associated n=1 Tax=Flocculibacter collagenilyticus TaxID=2744479 RepID=UPI0018F36725|nr:pyridoxal-dependent decarboxylase, exosortase A system-associated [Flocculibacter collagenilyticus]